MPHQGLPPSVARPCATIPCPRLASLSSIVIRGYVSGDATPASVPHRHRWRQPPNTGRRDTARPRLRPLPAAPVVQNVVMARVPPEKFAATAASLTDMGYNIDWVLPRQRGPSRLWSFASKITIAAVGIFSKILISTY